MPRWYAVFSTYDHPAEKMKTIADCIRRDRLGRFVTRTVVERKAGKKGQFHFALGIESEVRGQPPAELDHFLEIPLLKWPVRGEPGVRYVPFEREQLARMMGAEQTVEDIARVLRYSLAGELAPDDPFADPHRATTTDDEDRHLQRSQQYDQLLTWVSVMGSGSLAQLRAATLTLGLSTPADGTARILRRLRLLGHLETSADGKRWSAAPAAIVASGADPDRFFLAGARDQALLNAIRQYGELEQTPMADGNAPSHACFIPGDPRMVETVPRLRPLAAGPAAERLAAALPGLDGWVSTLQRVVGIRPEQYDLRRYDGVEFQDVASPTASGLHQFHDRTNTLSGPTGDPRFTLYFDAGDAAWYRGDWYGLRFLAESRRRGTTAVRYDPATRDLAVLRDLRWPEIYERAAVLASGRLPRMNATHLVYPDVSPALIASLAERLHLDVDTTGAMRDA